MGRSSFISRLALACVLLAATAGCGDSEKLPSMGGSCTLNSDCTDPLSCKFGRCHKQCNADRDCDLSQRCVKVDGRGICQLPEEKTCGPNTACLAPLACSSDNQCRTGCTTNADCLATQTCVAGTAGGASVCAEPADRPSAAYDGGASGLDSGTGGGATDGGLATPDAPSALPDLGSGIDGATGAGIDTKPDANSVTVDTQPNVVPDSNTIVADVRPDVPTQPDAPGAGGSGGNGGAGGMGGGGAGGSTGGVSGGPLMLALSVAGEPVVPKGKVQLTITVSNTSSRAVDGVNIVLRTPDGTNFNGSLDADPDASCYGGCNAGVEAKWGPVSLSAGSSRTFTVNANVLETVGDGDTLKAGVTVTATGLNPLAAARNIRVQAKPSAQLTLGTLKDPVTPGETMTFDLDVGQIGATALTGTQLVATLPAGVTVAGMSDGGTESSPRNVLWDLGSVPVGGLVHRSVDVTVDSGLASGTLLVATASLRFDGGADVDAIAERTVAVVGNPPPLRLGVTLDSNPVVPDGRVLITATISNVGTRALDGVTLLMRSDIGLQANGSLDADPDASCYGGCTPYNEASWTVGTLPAGVTRTIVFNATALATALGDGSLTSPLFALRAKDVNDINASKTIQVHSKPSAQMMLGTREPVLPGGTATLNLDVGQIGTTALSNAELHLFLPPGLTAGTIGDSGTQPKTGEIVWALGSVPVSGVLQRKVDVTAGSTLVAGAILPVRASLLYDGGLPVDVVSETSLAVVGAATALKVDITTGSSQVAPGGQMLYTITATNNSARAIDKVALMMRLPGTMQFNGAADAEPDASCYGGCTPYNEASWDLGTLEAGMNKIVTVNGSVPNTVLEGSLVSATFRLVATGVDDTLNARVTVPAHK